MTIIQFYFLFFKEIIYRNIVFLGDMELDKKSASIAIVGKDLPFQIVENDGIQRYLDMIVVEGEAEMDTEMVIENPVV